MLIFWIFPLLIDSKVSLRFQCLAVPLSWDWGSQPLLGLAVSSAPRGDGSVWWLMAAWWQLDGSLMADWHRLQLSKQFFIILRLGDSIHLDTSRYISIHLDTSRHQETVWRLPPASSQVPTAPGAPVTCPTPCPTPCPTHSTFIRIHSNSSAFVFAESALGPVSKSSGGTSRTGSLRCSWGKQRTKREKERIMLFYMKWEKWKWRKGSHVVMSSCRHVVMSSCHSHVMTTPSLCFPASKKMWPRLKSQPQRGSMTTCVSGNARAFKKPNDLVRSCEILWGRVRIEMNTNNDDVSVRHVWSLRLSSSAVMRSASNSLFHSALFFFVQKRFRACLNFCAWMESRLSRTSLWSPMLSLISALRRFQSICFASACRVSSAWPATSSCLKVCWRYAGSVVMGGPCLSVKWCSYKRPWSWEIWKLSVTGRCDTKRALVVSWQVSYKSATSRVRWVSSKSPKNSKKNSKSRQKLSIAFHSFPICSIFRRVVHPSRAVFCKSILPVKIRALLRSTIPVASQASYPYCKCWRRFQRVTSMPFMSSKARASGGISWALAQRPKQVHFKYCPAKSNVCVWMSVAGALQSVALSASFSITFHLPLTQQYNST